jgi:uncharacterized Fe-S cluster-containing radical SAM superfamily protein
MQLFPIIQEQHRRLVVAGSNPQKYRILKDFSRTYIEEQLKKEEKMISPIFRVFECVKPDKGRKLNIDLEHEFDPYSDSLMDYPSIIGHKLNKRWSLFNRLISVHIPLCPNNCWHCYVPKELYENAETRSDELTAKEIVYKFLEQRTADANIGKHSNILRITGGEPFLLPKLILECLLYLRERGLENEVFLWTETNLEPFITEIDQDPLTEGKERSFMDSDENKEILEQLSSFRNFAVHPCFHGLSENEFKMITGDKEYQVNLGQQVNGLRKLVNAGIDVYPTFGSNVCDPSNIVELFNGLKEVHAGLPLRVALVEYNFDYESVADRIKAEERAPDLFSKFANLRIWNNLLLINYGIGYAMVPRDFISISNGVVTAPLLPNPGGSDGDHKQEIIYLFKSSSRPQYHREILDILAFPTGHVYAIEYDKEWVQEDLYFHMRYAAKVYEGRKAIWTYVNKDDRTLLPFREAIIEKVETSDRILIIKFRLGNYLCWPLKKDLAESSTKSFRTYFGSRNIPPGGKYVLLGEDTKYYSFFEVEAPLITDSSDVLQHITPHLVTSKNKDMKQSLFYRLTTEKLTQKKKSRIDTSTIYEIRGGKPFNVTVNYYMPKDSDLIEKNQDVRTIDFQSSSPTINPFGESKVVFSKYGHKELEFLTEKVTKKKEVALTISSKYEEFRAAKIVMHIRILPPKVRHGVISLLAAFIFLITTVGLSIGSQALSQGKGLRDALKNSFDNLFSGSVPGNLAVVLGLLLAFWLSFCLGAKRTS